MHDWRSTLGVLGGEIYSTVKGKERNDKALICKTPRRAHNRGTTTKEEKIQVRRKSKVKQREVVVTLLNVTIFHNVLIPIFLDSYFSYILPRIHNDIHRVFQAI